MFGDGGFTATAEGFVYGSGVSCYDVIWTQPHSTLPLRDEHGKVAVSLTTQKNGVAVLVTAKLKAVAQPTAPRRTNLPGESMWKPVRLLYIGTTT